MMVKEGSGRRGANRRGRRDEESVAKLNEE